MFFTIVSPKYQLTLGIECRHALGLKPGMRIKQTVSDGKVILEPVKDAVELYGIFKRYAKGASLKDEDSALEQAIVEDVLDSMRIE